MIVHCYRPVVEAGTSSLKYLMVEASLQEHEGQVKIITTNKLIY